MEIYENETDIILRALVLPFAFCADDEIREQFLSDRELFYEKSNSTNFFKEMSEYVNSFTSDNYLCKYYDRNRFNSTFSYVANSHLKVCHINIRSINLHKHELAAYLSDLNCKFDIILLSECGNALRENVEEALSEYHLYCNPPSRSKGGAAILVRKSLNSNIEIINSQNQLKCNNCNKCEVESLWIKITNDILIGCVYRHPDGNVSHFNDLYSNF